MARAATKTPKKRAVRKSTKRTVRKSTARRPAPTHVIDRVTGKRRKAKRRGLKPGHKKHKAWRAAIGAANRRAWKVRRARKTDSASTSRRGRKPT